MIDTLKTYKILSKNKINNNAKKIVKNNPELAKLILDNTKHITGDLFGTLRERIYCILNNINEIPKCANCGNVVKFNHATNKYQTYCCLQCANTNITKKQKTRETNITKYGGPAPLCNNKVKQKMINTNIRLFGKKYHQQTHEGKQQRKNTNKQKYGTEQLFKSITIRNKIYQTMIEKYGTKFYTQTNISSEVLQKLNDPSWLCQQHIEKQKPLYEIANELNVSTFCIRSYFQKHNIQPLRFFTSNIQKQVVDFLKQQLNIPNIIINDRNIIFPQELDILIPEQNFAIEVNGIFWHSESKGKHKTYHFEKALRCKQKQITLFQFTDYQWIFQNQTIKNILTKQLTKQSKNVEFSQCELSINNNYIHQGNFFAEYSLKQFMTPDVCYQLNYNKQPVIMMFFKKIEHDTWELIDFFEMCNITVVDGFQKIFDVFIEQYEPKTVFYMLDNGLFDDKNIRGLNFHFSHFTQPTCIYFDKNDPYKILTFLQQNQQYEQKKQEKYWNCGESCWVWTNSTI